MGLLPQWRARTCAADYRHIRALGAGLIVTGAHELVMLASLTHWGCEFLGGAAVGGLATGAGYEINANRQMDRLEDDYRRGRMSREEYQDRRRQVERGSILY